MLDRSRSRDRSKTGGAFSPAGLFVTGAQGAWYDPSDFSTLFQDSAGSTPVTAVEQPVGLMLDRSRGGPGTNGAFRRNLLTFSEQFDDAGWGKGEMSVVADVAASPINTQTADRLVPSAVNTASHQVEQVLPIINGQTFVFSAFLKADGYDFAVLQINATSAGIGSFNLQTGQVVSVSAGMTASISALGGGWFRCSVTATVGETASRQFRIRAYDSAALSSFTGDGTSGILVWGAQLETGSTATAYQPITASWSATMAGNHATAPNDASRPVLRARYNQLTYSEQFDNAAWVKGGTTPPTIAANAGVAPDGTTTADRLIVGSVSSIYRVQQNANLISGAVYTQTVYVKKSSYQYAFMYGGGTAIPADDAILDLDNGILTLNTNSRGSVTPLANGWYRFAYTFTATATAADAVRIGFTDISNSVSITGDGVSGGLLWGAQLLTAADQTSTGNAYQRIAAATVYDTSNPVWRPYLAFDGVDDAMTISSSIHDVFQNVSGGTIWAGYMGVAALSGGGTPIPVVFVSTNVTTFATRASVTVDKSGGRRLDADSFVTPTDAGWAANGIYVGTNVSDWAGGNVIRRTNGAQVASTAYSSGAGSTSNTASLLASIGASGSPFANFLTGRLYSAIILGRAATTAELTATESWINGKTEAY